MRKFSKRSQTTPSGSEIVTLFTTLAITLPSTQILEMVSRLWFLFALLTLSACKKPTSNASPALPPLSYTQEIRPILAEKCLSCHNPASEKDIFKLSLAHPNLPFSFAFPHHDALDSTQEEMVTRWIASGQNIDPHWSLTALPETFSSSSIDDYFGELPPARDTPRTPPAPSTFSFHHSLTASLAGDFIGEKEATQFLRQGLDTPDHRLLSTAQMTLGLHLECAQCHHHPTDPISPTDYAHLKQLFTTPYDASHSTHPLNPPTALTHLSHPESLTQQQEQLQKRSIEGQQDYLAWLKNPEKLPIINDLADSFSFNGGRIRNLAIQSSAPAPASQQVTAPGIHRESLLFQEHTTIEIPDLHRQTVFTPVTYAFWMKTASDNFTILTHGITLTIQEGHLQARIARYWPGNAIGIRSSAPIAPLDRWNHIAFTYDGMRTPEGMQFFLNGKKIPTLATGTKLAGPVTFGPFTFGGKSSGPWQLDEFSRHLRALTPIEIRHLADGTALLKETPSAEYFLSSLDEKSRHLQQGIPKLLTQHFLEEGRDEIPVMEAIPVTSTARESSLVSLRVNSRLELAQGLQTELLARALVNHLWKQHFDQALIPQGLGYGSPVPQHLELLNWLASELIKNQWDLSKISQHIIQSKLYQTEYPTLREDGPVCPRPRLMKPKIRR